MSDTSQHPIQIVVGYDFSELAALALSRALALVRGEPRHMLHVLAVLDERGGLGLSSKRHKPTYLDGLEIEEALTKELSARIDASRPGHKIHFFVHVRIGEPAEQILHLGQEIGAHLIMVGSQGHTRLERLLLGSVSEKVMREAKCPVLVVRPREYEDVELLTIVDAPPKHAGEYIKPHRYTYENQLIVKQSAAWPWY